MRSLALVSAALAGVAALAGCARAERPPIEACADAADASSAATTRATSRPILGMLMLPNTAVVLARLDPLSLRPVSRPVEVGEYHDTWSVSPDRSRIAVGTGGQGIGIEIVDLEAMKVVRQIRTGIAAEEVGWLASRLLVAGLQRGGTVLVDPSTGRILRRWRHLSDPQVSARTPDGLVMLFPGPRPATADGTAAARLAIVDARGRLRSAVLERIPLALRDGVQWDEAGLAVDPDRARAYVFAADAPVAEIDLETMSVAYRRLEPLLLRPGELTGSEARSEGEQTWRHRRALSLRDGRVLVFGRDFFGTAAGEDRGIAAGAILVDTAMWSSCVLDAEASGAAFVAGRVLVYGRADRASLGVRAYTLDGRSVFELFPREHVSHIQGASGRAYVHTPRAVYVVDVSSGSVVSEIAPRAELVDVVTDARSSPAAEDLAFLDYQAQ